jgi:outer membrane lipoprotein-sorting protein
MTSRRAFLLCGTSALLGAWGPTLARTARGQDATDLLAEVATARHELRTLVASFEQVRRIGLLATDVVSRGKMTLVRPNRLRWELLPPDAMTYWVGPEGLAYASESSRATVDRQTAGPLGDVMNDLLLFLGGDLSTLRTRHDLTATRVDQGVRIEARPRDKSLQRILRRLELVLAKDRVTPVHVIVEETEKDFVRVRFSAVERNVDVEPSVMRPGR